MPNPNRKLIINFNLLLDRETDNWLIQSANTADLSKAQIVRAAIRNYYRMTFQRTPICADGGACRCPHAHIYAPAPSPPDPDPDSRHDH